MSPATSSHVSRDFNLTGGSGGEGTDVYIQKNWYFPMVERPQCLEAQCVYLYRVEQRGGVTVYGRTRRQDLLCTDIQGGRYVAE